MQLRPGGEMVPAAASKHKWGPCSTRWAMGGPHRLITTAQTPAPNVTSSRWQRSYLLDVLDESKCSDSRGRLCRLIGYRVNLLLQPWGLFIRSSHSPAVLCLLRLDPVCNWSPWGLSPQARGLTFGNAMFFICSLNTWDKWIWLSRLLDWKRRRILSFSKSVALV